MSNTQTFTEQQLREDFRRQVEKVLKNYCIGSGSGEDWIGLRGELLIELEEAILGKEDFR